MNKLYNIMKCFRFIVKNIWSHKKIYYLYMLIEVINKSILPLMIVVIPGLIIDMLMDSKFQPAMFYAIIFCAANFITDLLNLVIGNKKEIAEIFINEKITEELGLHIMKLKYEVLEQKTTLDEYNFSIRCIERNSISKLGSVLETIISSTIVLMGVTYIISSLNFLIIFLMIIVVIVNAFGEVFRLRHVYEREQGEANVSRNLYYARDELIKKEYAKEIRIYNLSNFISNKVRKYADGLCKLWEKAAYDSIKAVYWTYIMKGLQLFIVNGYIAILCLKGKISVGEFAVYVSAVNTLSSSSINIVNTFINHPILLQPHPAAASLQIFAFKNFCGQS